MGGENNVGVVGEKASTRKIMVCVDESEESMYALLWRPIFVYSGFDKSDILSHDALSSLDRRDKEMACWVLQRAEKLCMEHHVKVEGKVEEGDPGDVICEMVEALKADLLVMGSHGYGRLTREILRSVSSHCVQSASCPVLVVKMPK